MKRLYTYCFWTRRHVSVLILLVSANAPVSSAHCPSSGLDGRPRSDRIPGRERTVPRWDLQLFDEDEMCLVAQGWAE